ncbi:MAG TPA: MBL fold metallo-hydrolase [Hyphomicrobiaceae bacterium]|jgi:phosphoribosyl 1,2-cyclic phosphate phosphodiesterase|nr:MBL fold metallo-hydrolase [Hyphomicrobiaceae bacterium]
MSTRFTILGTGSSGGVPRVGNVWGNCDPANPKNRRRRCALLVEKFGPKGKTTVLVDTPPDIREQLLEARVDHLDGVLFTHDHADHTHGIDDLRGIFFLTKRRLDVFADRRTRQTLEARFDYCFAQPPGSLYPAILKAHDINPAEPLRIHGAGGAIDIFPVMQVHGDGTSLGFRFSSLAYSPDISGIPDGSLPVLQGIDVWIVDSLRPAAHPSHFSVGQALDWIERLKVKRGILTHMTVELDYDALRRQLPAHVEPAYDGMTIELP